MLDDRLRNLIDITSETLELDQAVIEKDYYVTQIIHALANTENENFRLVFAGGTCLAKAHKIVRRMSEDVDFKIQFKRNAENFSKAQFIRELKQFRILIASKLNVPGLQIGNSSVRNEGQYSRIEMKYISLFPIHASLRSNVLLEFTLSEIRLSIEDQRIKTLIEETLNIEILNTSFINCASINETATEKWVGLTRRIAAIDRGYHHEDKTLVRHIYDLNAIDAATKLNNHFFDLAKIIVNHDAKQFKNQHPEYSRDPSEEIKHSLFLLRSQPYWKDRYNEFIETMVYHDSSSLDYETALNVVETISERMIKSLG